MAITLGYWNIRAMGEVSRYLLRYSGVEWTDRRIELTEEGYQTWYSQKYELGLDLPNLPYLIDGDVKITQSVAIARYLGRKFGLVPGEDEKEVVKCEMVEQEAADLRAAFQAILMPREQFEAKKPAYFEKLDKKLEMLDKYIGQGPFVLGNKLTYVDFMVFEYVSQISKLSPERVDKAENIGRLIHNFQNLPQLEEYFHSEEFKAGVPINPSFTAFPG